MNISQFLKRWKYFRLIFTISIFVENLSNLLFYELLCLHIHLALAAMFFLFHFLFLQIFFRSFSHSISHKYFIWPCKQRISSICFLEPCHDTPFLEYHRGIGTIPAFYSEGTTFRTGPKDQLFCGICESLVP